MVEEEDDDDDEGESVLTDSKSTNSTNPVAKNRSDELQRKSATDTSVNLAGMFHNLLEVHHLLFDNIDVFSVSAFVLWHVFCVQNVTIFSDVVKKGHDQDLKAKLKARTDLRGL